MAGDCDIYERTAPVGSFPTGISWVGALDMAGNVSEWVIFSSLLKDYASSAPVGLVPARGGSFNAGSLGIRSADRTGGAQLDFDWLDWIGFRLAISSTEM
jgi:formylglycine-generating enzyme required for sulfatase activity